MNDVAELITGLREASAYPHPCSEIVLIETHISYVLLTGEFAYKLKKSVSLPFVDFSTQELRRRSCEAELSLNRRLAAEIYLDVVPVGGTPQAPRIGATPAIEYAVKMVQFPSSHRLDRLLETNAVDRRAFQALAGRLADFHQGLTPASAASTLRAVMTNIAALAKVVGPAERRTLESISAWLDTTSSALDQALQRRERDGFVRECHGDLHLRNLVMIDDRLVPFDCIEFSAALRTIDTYDEVAFLVMDLMASGREDFAFAFLVSYIEAAGDYDGLSVLRFYLVHRALVRCYVGKLTASPGNGIAFSAYLELAAKLTAPQEPILLITNGLSGSGKSTLTEALIPRLPGIRLRSDLVRRQAHGLAPTQRSSSGLHSGLYSPAATGAAYERLAELAGVALDAGFNVIVDAAFLKRAQREAFGRLAEDRSVRFVVLAVEANEAVLRERVAQRHAGSLDASEADIAVLEDQLASAEPIEPREPGVTVVVDTTGRVDTDDLVTAIRA